MIEQRRLAAFGGRQPGRRRKQQGARDAKGVSDRERKYRRIAEDCRGRSAEAIRRADQWAQELSDLARQSREAQKARQKALDKAMRNDFLEEDINQRIELEVEERDAPKRSRRATECEQRE